MHTAIASSFLHDVTSKYAPPTYKQLTQDIFLLTITSRPTLRPTHLPIRWVLGALSLGVKGPGRNESEHTPPSSAEVKECVALCLHTPILLHGVVLS